MLLANAQISRLERLRLSPSGNPRFKVTLLLEDGSPRVLNTKSDASCNYGIENMEFRWPNKVNVVVEKQQIVYVYEVSE